MKNIFSGKVVLITGGTGTFGRAFIEYLLERDFGEIRIFSRDELKQEQMRIDIGNHKIKFYIGDVRDLTSINHAMIGVDYVFHAAALKQVPSCEFFPQQAVLTNIFGSYNVIESAIANQVKKLVFLSTDKAVYPINAMGMTKALMEKVALAAARNLKESNTIISGVRYGNVMCSRGSVIPLFIEQIKKNNPITITLPYMTRFLLPLGSAINLVAYALEYARQGDFFIRKSPACTIEDLAKALKNVFNSDVPIKTIGIRHGEKIFETLMTCQEFKRVEDLGDYYRLQMDGRDLNYAKYFTEGNFKENNLEDYTSDNTNRLTVPEIQDLLLSLPEIRRGL